MALIHTLTYNGSSVVIDEPIGFDNFKVSFKRHEYHGITAEVSEQNLEFYGAAIAIIKQAYEADIDSEVDYSVADGDITIYTGRLDLSTYNEQLSEYHSVSCRVGEIGIKTTFNNRTDTDVDLNDTTTMDGVSIGFAPWQFLQIPARQLIHTNVARQKKNKLITSNWVPVYYSNATVGYFTLDDIPTNEFGSTNTELVWSTSTPSSNDSMYSVGDEEAIADFRNEYGEGCKMDIEGELKARLDFSVTFKPGYSSATIGVSFNSGNDYISLHLDADEENSFEDTFSWKETNLNAESNYTPSIRFNVDWDVVNSLSFLLAIYENASITMRMADTIQVPKLSVSMLSAYDSLNRVTKQISDNSLEVKSDWYYLNVAQNVYGGGALKYITSGYLIRNIVKDTPMSFRSLIESFAALDCIGWGFSSENGSDVIRVERWDWFYKPAVTITLANVLEVKKTLDTGRVITGLKIGYKKYDTSSDYNSIDTIHSERTFETGIKAISNIKSVLCDFIADNYAIEETRRAWTRVDRTESFNYDENIFVLEAYKNNSGLAIGNTAYSVEGINRPDELINARISPRQCAARWADFIFATTSKRNMKFTTGTINCDASLLFRDRTSYYYLSAINGKTSENADIAYQHAKFKSENWEFECPITLSQYKSIKANPYGLIHVNDVYGWIKEFSYSFADGMATFKLIAKY